MSLRSQALWYAAVLQAYYAQAFFDGFLFWLWPADPSAGGLSDSSCTPAGKPLVLAELLARWGPAAAAASGAPA